MRRFYATLGFIIVIYVSLSTTVSHARYIKMDMNVKTRLEADMLTVSVESINNGDEPAYNVMVNVEIGGQSKVSDIKENVEVKEGFKTEFDFELSFDKPGSYPVLVRADYADVNRYAFSALCLAHINYKRGAYPKVFGKMNPLKIVEKGRVHLKLMSLDYKEKRLTVRLLVPKDIWASDPVKKIHLNSMEEKDLRFHISNFSALPGAKCAIYALMEYEDEEKHDSSSAMSTVEIIEKRKLVKEYRFVLVGVPLGLLVLYLLSVLIRKRKRAGSAT